MDKLSKTIVVLCVTSLTLWLFSTLEPWIDETFREEKIDIESDIEKCGKYTPYRGKDDILMCWCSDNEKGKPGKCR